MNDLSSRHVYTASDGVGLVGDVGGPAGAPAVILMHGGGQTRHSWSGGMRALVDRGYRVINYDARGHGESDWSPAGAYSFDDRVADLRAVVDTLDAPYALVGASMGGATAIHAVASGMAPAAVVLVDIVPEAEPEGIARIVTFMGDNRGGFATLDEAAEAVAAYNPDRPRPDDTSGLMRNLRARDGRLYWHWDPGIIPRGEELAAQHAGVVAAAAVMARRADLPVLLVRGLRSDVVGDAGVAAFRAMMPQTEVVDVIGAGHMVAGDRNDAFNRGVLDFLARAMPANGGATG